MKRLLLLPAALMLVAPASFQFRAEAGNGVLICHTPPGNPLNSREMIVDERAVDLHLQKHGDTIGPCYGDIIPQ
ncbi:MAG: hypothetical protein R2729_00875 [Bryobacteraceae bacterium]